MARGVYAKPLDGSERLSPPVDRSDESSHELLTRAQSGDNESLERLCARYLPRLRRWARGRLPHWARERLDTDDLVQETVLNSVRRIESFEVRMNGSFHGYLRQALVNRIRDEIRRARRRPEEVGESAGDEHDPGPSPLDEAIGRQAREAYEAALARLRDEDREAIVARVELGCSHEETAAALGKPSADAARMAVARALVRLAREMSGGG
jgi:RNA polymerase sigma-70 factor (ECF subfamily)